jgi:hypothetical protein
MKRQLPFNELGVEGLNPKAEMIQVSGLLARRRSAGTPKLSVDRDQVDQRTARTELHEPDRVLAALDGAAKSLTVEVHHPREVDYAKHQMIDID